MAATELGHIISLIDLAHFSVVTDKVGITRYITVIEILRLGICQMTVCMYRQCSVERKALIIHCSPHVLSTNSMCWPPLNVRRNPNTFGFLGICN